ncbi:MAG: hypothetical protein LW650_08620 [Planctomycetaceae bacterium]|nr:hypothetical protein [Phycisphaerales bacterium]MCE2653543.1 hypothetical protein [Planctomycetaceae bacterium]
MVSGKVCRFCGEDCSARPRVKEADTGRYACKSCAEQAAAQAAQQAAARATVAQRARAARVASTPASAAPAFDPDAGARVCTNCGSTVAASAAKCGGCGFDFATGKTPGMVEAKPAPRPKAARPGSKSSGKSSGKSRRWSSAEVGMDPLSQHPWISTLVGVGAVAGLGVLAAQAEDPSLTAILWIVAFAISLLVYVGAIFGAFRDGSTGWGVVNAANAVLPILGLATLYWIFLVNERIYLRVTYAIGVATWVTLMIVTQGRGWGGS